LAEVNCILQSRCWSTLHREGLSGIIFKPLYKTYPIFKQPYG